jgi:hypothetical protein
MADQLLPMPADIEPDTWLDPATDQVEALAQAAYRQLRDAAPQQCGTLHFALPRCDLAVRYAGQTLANALTAAFGHLRADSPGGRGLQLEWQIADCALLGGLPQLPPPPRPLHQFGSLYCNSAATKLAERRPGFVTALDVPTLRLTTIANGVESVDTDLAAKPLLRFLLSLLLRQNIVMCHSALLGGSDSGLLITGKGGVGKSTISAAAVMAGAGFCSDDFVALEWTGTELIGHCLYATLMLTSDQMERFPELASHAVRLRSDTFDKHMVPLASSFPDRIRRSLRVDGVAIPEITADPSSALTAGRRGAMLRAIMPSTLIASPWREAERTRFLFEHVGALTPLIYRSGSEFSAIAAPLRKRYGF